MDILKSNKYINEKLNIPPITKDELSKIRNTSSNAGNLRQMLSDMSCKQLTIFMRKIKAFGNEDTVEVFSFDTLTKIMETAINNGYTVQLKKLSNDANTYLFVKYVNSQYLKICEIEGMPDNLIESLPFRFDDIIKDNPTAIAIAATVIGKGKQ